MVWRALRVLALRRDEHVFRGAGDAEQHVRRLDQVCGVFDSGEIRNARGFLSQTRTSKPPAHVRRLRRPAPFQRRLEPPFDESGKSERSRERKPEYERQKILWFKYLTNYKEEVYEAGDNNRSPGPAIHPLGFVEGCGSYAQHTKNAQPKRKQAGRCYNVKPGLKQSGIISVSCSLQDCLRRGRAKAIQ